MSHASNKLANTTAAAALIGGYSDSESGSGTPISYIKPTDGHERIVAVKIHFTAAPVANEDLVIFSDNLDLGANHQFVYLTQDCAGLTDIIFTDPIFLAGEERLRISYANSDARDYGITVIYGR